MNAHTREHSHQLPRTATWHSATNGQELRPEAGHEGLREFGQQISSDSILKSCGMRMRKGAVGSSEEILETQKTCKKHWLCAICGPSSATKSAQRVARLLRGWTNQGHVVIFLTLTQIHHLHDRLPILWDRLTHGWKGIARGDGWRGERDSYGIHGYVRATEVVHSTTTGWNVHFHVLLLVESALTTTQLEALKLSLTLRFVQALANRGGNATQSGQNIKMMSPGTEDQLARYLTKGTTIVRSSPSRSPLAILQDLQRTGEGHRIWDEYTAAISGSGRKRQLSPSQHIDILCSDSVY